MFTKHAMEWLGALPPPPLNTASLAELLHDLSVADTRSDTVAALSQVPAYLPKIMRETETV